MSTATGVFFLSLTAIPITYGLNFAFQLSWGQWPVFLIGCVLLPFIALAAYMLVKSSSGKHKITDPCFYVFSVFAFTSVIDMVIALELDGVIDNFVTFYLKEGERYLNTAHGTMINYWDGTGQYCMYLMMVTAIVWKQSYREVALYWFGSIMMSLVVFMPGNIAGKFGSELTVSYILNFPFVVLPFLIVIKKWREEPTYEWSPSEARTVQTKSIFRRPLDLFFVLYLLGAAIFSFLRVLAAWESPLGWAKMYLDDYEPYLKDPVSYPKIHVSIYWFYFVPYYVCTIYGLIYPGNSWMPDAALIHAGASAQGQISHIGASVHSRTPYIYRIPNSSRPMVYVLNLLLLIIPQVMSYKFTYSPQFFASLDQRESTNGQLKKKER